MTYYLLYFGIARNEFRTEDFEELLIQARARNEFLGITGKLLHCEGSFIQLLEGTQTAVEEVYQSIVADKRLIAVKTITCGTGAERYYKDWSMDFTNVPMSVINEIENCIYPDVAAYVKSSSAIRLLRLLAMT
jgi:hypothetical protein